MSRVKPRLDDLFAAMELEEIDEIEPAFVVAPEQVYGSTHPELPSIAHHEDEEVEQDGYESEEEMEFRNEMDFYARASGGSSGMTTMEGMNPRMFYALRNQNRSESDLFLDKVEEYYREINATMSFNRDQHFFMNLLSKHPHPRFLHVPLCVSMLSFYNRSGRYEWNITEYNKIKEKYSEQDVIRYIELFNLYAR
jgi:hypothetical protein